MSLLRTLIPDGLKKWLAFGHGVGIEVVGPHGGESLRVTAVRVHPGGARVVGTLSFEDAMHHAAGVWGTEYAAFVRKHGCAHVAATVLLPRREVMVRNLALPGVTDKDLPAAIEFQLDGLHPYREEDVATSWARIPGTSSVLIAITRRAVIERFVTLFGEAGIEVGAFTCSAAAIHSALRMFRDAPSSSGLLAYEPAESGVEIYGESASRPVFSATFDVPLERAAPMAASELRLDADTAPHGLDTLFNASPALPYAAALASACPLMALPLNLLPAELRPVRCALAVDSLRRLGRRCSAIGCCAGTLPALRHSALPGFAERRNRPRGAASRPLNRTRPPDRNRAPQHCATGRPACPHQKRYGRARRDDPHPAAARLAQSARNYTHPSDAGWGNAAGRAAAANHRRLAALSRL